jgi:hypothetical protein
MGGELDGRPAEQPGERGESDQSPQKMRLRYEIVRFMPIDS